MQDTSHAHADSFAPFLSFPLRKQAYFLGGSRGSLLPQITDGWEKESLAAHWQTPQHRAGLWGKLPVQGSSHAWGEGNLSKSERLGQGCILPMPAASGCPSLPAAQPCLRSEVWGPVLGPLGSSIAHQTGGKKGGNELFKGKLTEKAWRGGGGTDAKEREKYNLKEWEWTEIASE